MGKHHDPQQAPMSYWSLGSTRMRGVAILLTPAAALLASAWNEDRWTSRAIGVKIDDLFLLNVYAPTIRAEREEFFTGLHDWNMPPGDTVIVGGLNSV